MTLLGQVPSCCKWSKSFFICRKLPLLVHLKVYRKILDGCMAAKFRTEKRKLSNNSVWKLWKFGKPPPSPSCGLQHGLGGEMLETEGVRMCCPSYQEPWKLILLGTHPDTVPTIHLGLCSESILAAKQEQQDCLGLVKFWWGLLCIEPLGYRTLGPGIDKLSSCNILYIRWALTGFLRSCFQIRGIPSSALRQQ